MELSPTLPVTDAVRRMQAARQSLALVVRGGEVVGVVDLEDLRFARDWAGDTATVAQATTMRLTEIAGIRQPRDVRPY